MYEYQNRRREYQTGKCSPSVPGIWCHGCHRLLEYPECTIANSLGTKERDTAEYQGTFWGVPRGYGVSRVPRGILNWYSVDSYQDLAETRFPVMIGALYAQFPVIKTSGHNNINKTFGVDFWFRAMFFIPGTPCSPAGTKTIICVMDTEPGMAIFGTKINLQFGGRREGENGPKSVWPRGRIVYGFGRFRQKHR